MSVASAMAQPGSFAFQKQLRVTFTLAPQGNALAPQGNTFPGTNSNTLILSGLRTIANLKGVVRYLPTLDLEIYGMRQQDMNALSVIRFGPLNNSLQNNFVSVEANGGTGWVTVFAGTIIDASPQYQAMPDVYFHVQAMSGYLAGIKPATPMSYPNGVSIVTALDVIAQQMDLTLKNNGVTGNLGGSRYWAGSPKDQLEAVCKASNTDYYIDPNGTLQICPVGQARLNTPLVTLTPQTGLIGYPSIEQGGIHVEALFNPLFLLASSIGISGSDVPAANGTWVPYAMAHQLESVKFGGLWHTSIDANPVPT